MTAYDIAYEEGNGDITRMIDEAEMRERNRGEGGGGDTAAAERNDGEKRPADDEPDPEEPKKSSFACALL